MDLKDPKDLCLFTWSGPAYWPRCHQFSDILSFLLVLKEQQKPWVSQPRTVSVLLCCVSSYVLVSLAIPEGFLLFLQYIFQWLPIKRQLQPSSGLCLPQGISYSEYCSKSNNLQCMLQEDDEADVKTPVIMCVLLSYSNNWSLFYNLKV